MIKYISHRGNISGRIEDVENRPDYINDTLSIGFDVEIDMWYTNNNWYLGHDAPQYKIDNEWIIDRKDKLWIHAKNLESFHNLLEMGVTCFWHQSDDFTLTSNGYIWTYPNKEVTKKSIIVNLDKEINNSILNTAYGVCGDYVNLWS